MMVIFGRKAVAAFLAAFLLVTGVSGAARRLDPDFVYQRSVLAANTLQPVAYIVFTLQNRGLSTYALPDSGYSNLTHHDELLRVLVRCADHRAVVVTLRDRHGEIEAHPQPELVEGRNYQMSSVWDLGEFPTDDFGLRLGSMPPAATDFNAAAATPPPTITSVLAINSGYSIVDLGDTTIDGRAVYHLGMTPIRDPARHVLRELWVDKVTFLPARYVAERFIDDGPYPFSYLIKVDSAVIDGHLINVDASGYATHPGLRAGAMETEVGSWSIVDAAFPEAEPNWVFDPVLWHEHRGEAIPGLAPSFASAPH